MAAPDLLIVIERAEEVIVAYAADPDDWIASFRKREGFPAREWAKRMVFLYNQKRSPEGDQKLRNSLDPNTR